MLILITGRFAILVLHRRVMSMRLAKNQQQQQRQLMYELCDLKKLFENNGIKVTDFNGFVLKTDRGDTWTLVLGIFYKNGEPVVEKELIDSIVPPKKTRKKKCIIRT
jgi:hypothetical protein